MANEVTVQHPAMQTAANQLDDAYSVVTGLQQQLRNHHATLVGTWKGQAAGAFTNVFNTFDTELTKVLKVMDQLHEKMVGSHAQYNASEANASQTVNKVANLLNS